MERFLEKFKTWKDELDCMTERNEQQIILDAVQSFLRYMLSVWTSDRFEIVTFGIKESHSGHVSYFEKVQLSSLIQEEESLKDVKVEANDSDEENPVGCELESSVTHASGVNRDNIPTSDTEIPVETFPRAKTRRSQRMLLKHRRKKIRQQQRNENTKCEKSSDSKYNVLSRKKCNVQVITPPEDVEYFCLVCQNGCTWTNKDVFVKHFEDNHFVKVGRQWELPCNKCDKKFKRSGGKNPFSSILVPFIHHHIDKHNMEIPRFCKYYKCLEHEQCGYSSVLSLHIYHHIKRFQKQDSICKNPKNKTVCDSCGREMLVGSLKTHLQTCSISLEERRKFECSVCKMKFAAKHCLEAHVARKHDLAKPYICTRCAEQFFLKNDLVRHMWVHHKENISGRPLGTCEICGFQTIDGILIKTHKKIHLEESHICTICQKVFKNKLRLNSHRRVVHGQPKPNIKKPYPCPHCPYIAGKSSHLKRHVSRKHTTSDSAYFEKYMPGEPMDCEIACSQPFNLQPQQLYLDIPSSVSLQQHTCWEQNNTLR